MISLILLVLAVYEISMYCGWWAGHGLFTPLNWRVFIFLGWYLHWISKQPLDNNCRWCERIR